MGHWRPAFHSPFDEEKQKMLVVLMAHIYNPNIQEAEAGGSQVQGQPGLHGETLSQQNETKQE
jgi:hypothetical protein